MYLPEWTLALTEGMAHLCQVPGNTSSLSLHSLPCSAAVWKEKNCSRRRSWTGLGSTLSLGLEIRDQDPHAEWSSCGHVRHQQYQRRRHSWDMPGLWRCYLWSIIPHLQLWNSKSFEKLEGLFCLQVCGKLIWQHPPTPNLCEAICYIYISHLKYNSNIMFQGKKYTMCLFMAKS